MHDSRMVLRLDPRVPLVWRDPHTLQLGVDRPLAVLAEVTTGEERLVAALRRGVGDDGFGALCELTGAGRAAGAALLASLRPALLRDEERPAALVAVDGEGPVAEAIAAHLAERGHRTSRPDELAEAVDLAVLVGDFALPPRRHGRWLRRDIPHLAVVIGDAETRVGPLVEPGEGPCVLCHELAAADADPAWPAIASQLLGLRAPAVSALVAAETAAIAARAAIARLERRERRLAGRVVHLDAVTGARRGERVAPHPGCACRALPGNATALGPRRAAPSAPSSARGAAAPG